MLAKVCIIFVFALIILDALRKVQVWGEFHKNYDSIVKNFSEIKNIIDSKKEVSEGNIILNGYNLKYKDVKELLMKYEMFIFSTMKLYEEIKEYSLISKNLKEINIELVDIYYKVRMMRWKNK